MRVTCWPSRRARGCSHSWRAWASGGDGRVGGGAWAPPRRGARASRAVASGWAGVAREGAAGDWRPRDAWSIAPNALPGRDPPEAYRLLAAWLAPSIPLNPARLREVERSGRELGAQLGPGRGRGASEAVGRALRAPGSLRSAIESGRGARCSGWATVPIGRRCAPANQSCARFIGGSRGLLDTIEPSAFPQDPDEAGCVIEVEGLAGG